MTSLSEVARRFPKLEPRPIESSPSALLGGCTVPGLFFRSSVAVGPGHEPERRVVGPLGALPQQGERGVLGRSLGGKQRQDAIVEEGHRGLGSQPSMLLNFAESISQRPALDDVSVQAHPGG